MDGNIATFAPGLPGLQYSTYPYQVPNGHSALAAYCAASQPLFPQTGFGNVLGQMAPPIGGGIGGAFGNPQLGTIPGGWGGQLANFAQSFPQIAQPWYAPYGQQGCAVPGSLAAYYGIPQQLAPQPWLGSFLGQPGQPIAYGIGGTFGMPQIGGYLGEFGSQLPGYGSLVSPQAIQVAQQSGQIAQQAAWQVAQQAAQTAHQVAQQVALQAAQQVGQQAAQVAQHVAHQVAAACVAQQMQSPWNPLGVPYATLQPGTNVFGQIPQPFGASLGAAFGYPQFGNPYGVVGGQLPLAISPLVGLPQAAIQGGFGAWGGVPAGGYSMIPPGLRPLNPLAGAPLGNQTQLAATPRFSFAS